MKLRNDDKPNAYKAERLWTAKINTLKTSITRLFQKKGRSNNTQLFKAKFILKYNIQIYFLSERKRLVSSLQRSAG
jgi:hypothetical protein